MRNIIFLLFFSLGLLTLIGCAEDDSITITFQTNGGTSIEEMTLTAFVFSDLPQTTKDGYQFDGWYVDEALTESLGINTVITSSLTLYAKWILIEPSQFTIVFDTNGGLEISAIIITFGQDYTLPTPEKEGHLFLGWFTDADNLIPLDRTSNLLEDTTLYAKWEINTYQIIFETNEGETISPMDRFYGQTLDHLPLPVRDNYDFIGWYLDPAFSEPLNFSIMPSYDLVFYAKWVSSMVTISFDTGGATSVDDIMGYPNDPFTEPLEPTKLGYIFAGWFLSIDATEQYQFDVIPSQSMTLYADWATEGLEFLLIEETDTYEVGIGEAIDILDVFIPKYHQGKKVTHIMSFGFQNGSDMTSIHLPNTITHINQMGFIYAHGLKTIHLPISLTYIGPSAFRFCYDLEAITVDSEHLYFESIEGVLFSKDLDTLIRYPQKKNNTSYDIPNFVETIAEDAFSSANNLTSIDLGTGVKTIKSHAFFRTNHITAIVISDQVTTIELYAFRQSYALSSVTLGSGLTQISSYMFEGCVSLETIVIPDNINAIGYGAFYDCTNLKEVFIRRTTINDPITGGIFMFTNTHTTLKIYFADAIALNYYKTAPIWLSYASKMYLGNPPA